MLTQSKHYKNLEESILRSDAFILNSREDAIWTPGSDSYDTEPY